MSLEIDHIFIASKTHAPEAELLKTLGLKEGTPNQHLGQGTANRRFFFHSMFIELLYLVEEQEAQSPAVQATQLYERLKPIDQTISPFGICLRPAQGTFYTETFPCWNYHPPYLPAHLSIPMALDNPLSEPRWFVLPFGAVPSDAVPEKRQPLTHKLGLQKLTALRITQPNQVKSQAAQQINKTANLSIQQGKEHLLELFFDDGQAGSSHDFRPALPLTIHW